ncbi:hypothetical protein HK097_010666 [Rhizophlyctis rosea]|uniref:Alpha/beta hydrolase fold-3 domain-containing protein n=1 Tax=Rhizophlyctis rosea TaxID=64517 RepID=A0AAD5SIT0_9FUNG|nr:hypothetical protein HK097_010666 [Rhizophlyctis rosea]
MSTVYKRPQCATWFLRFRISLMRGIGAILRFLLVKPYPRATVTYSDTNPRHRCIVYRPPTMTAATGLYVHIHGGGFSGGVPEEDGEFCSYLAEKADLTVVSAQYRFAPEHPFPTGLNDALEVVEWAKREYGVGKKLAVGGSSSGGTFALALAQLLARKGTPLDSVVALYPVMDFSPDSKSTLPEKNPWIRDLFHEAYLLKVDGDDDLKNPILSPKYAPAAQMPPSIVMIIPEVDPNRPDMEDFMERMEREKGVGVISLFCAKCFHGWDHISEWLLGPERTKSKWEALDLIATEMRKVLH